VSGPADLLQEAPPPPDRSAAQARLARSYRWGLSAGFAFLGLLDSVYLTWIKLANAAYTCSNIGDCETVNNSSYSVVGGIPIAALGAVAYAVILLMLLLDRRPSGRSEPLRFGVFGLSLAGTLYSAYLTYVEVAILKAICPFCVASAVIMTALLVLSILRLPTSEG